MNRKRSISGIVICVVVTALVIAAGSAGSVEVGGYPLFALCGAFIFLVHLIAFIPSYSMRTEHYFDLTGSISYVSTVLFALLFNSERTFHSILLGALVLVWSIRLGSFLFVRVKQAGRDDRFDRMKHDFLAFAMVWCLSGLWVLLTAAAAFAAMTSSSDANPIGYTVAGFVMWVVGFGIEVVADRQKSRFRERTENRDRFIAEGLWAWSRHPNYVGEIVLWFGIAVIAFPALSGWQYATLVSPFFVWFLLTRVSGVPMLEAKAEAKWGDDEAYRAYRDSTPVLFPGLHFKFNAKTP